MVTPVSSQEFESFVPVFDYVPEEWKEAHEVLVEYFRKVSNAINVRTIGYYLDEELLSGDQFYPGVVAAGNNPGVFRSILRKVIDTGALVPGVNPPIPHGVVNDVNFRLIRGWVAATNSTTLTSQELPRSDTIIVGPNILITSPGTFDRSQFTMEYIQEL